MNNNDRAGRRRGNRQAHAGRQVDHNIEDLIWQPNELLCELCHDEISHQYHRVEDGGQYIPSWANAYRLHRWGDLCDNAHAICLKCAVHTYAHHRHYQGDIERDADERQLVGNFPCPFCRRVSASSIFLFAKVWRHWGAPPGFSRVNGVEPVPHTRSFTQDILEVFNRVRRRRLVPVELPLNNGGVEPNPPPLPAPVVPAPNQDPPPVEPLQDGIPVAVVLGPIDVPNPPAVIPPAVPVAPPQPVMPVVEYEEGFNPRSRRTKTVFLYGPTHLTTTYMIAGLGIISGLARRNHSLWNFRSWGLIRQRMFWIPTALMGTYIALDLCFKRFLDQKLYDDMRISIPAITLQWLERSYLPAYFTRQREALIYEEQFNILFHQLRSNSYSPTVARSAQKLWDSPEMGFPKNLDDEIVHNTVIYLAQRIMVRRKREVDLLGVSEALQYTRL